MRWKQILQADPATYDHEYALQLMRDDPHRAIMYRDSFEARKPEVLPKLLIFGDTCPNLVKAIPTAVYKEETEDVLKTDRPEDDYLDGMRYTLHSKNVENNKEPQKSYVQRHLDEVRKAQPNVDFNSICWAASKAEEDYKKINDPKKTFSWPLEGTREYKRRRYSLGVQ